MRSLRWFFRCCGRGQGVRGFGVWGLGFYSEGVGFFRGSLAPLKGSIKDLEGCRSFGH